MTHFLRFPDEQSWIKAATEAGFCSEPVRERNADGTFVANDPSTPADEAWQPNTLIAYTHERAIDVVGPITRGGEYDEDGKVLVKPKTLKGFHVNFIGELPPGWDEYVVEPVEPARVFA